MLKKTLLKNTHEFLEKKFSENFFLFKKSNKKRLKLLSIKGIFLKKKLLKFKQNNLRLFKQKNESLQKNLPEKSLNKLVSFKKYNNFLVSLHMIKSEFEKRQTRTSDFKNKLKERKKLSILYGNLSNKKIKKTLHLACKLHGNTADNFLILLERRLDVILYRALFFSSIKSARQWIGCNKILINLRYINIASYKLNFGDVISIKPRHRKLVASQILKFFLRYNLHNQNNIAKKIQSKEKKLILNSEKKFIFKFSRNKLSSKTNIKLKKTKFKPSKTLFFLTFNLWKNIIFTNKNLSKSKGKSYKNKFFITDLNLEKKNKRILLDRKNSNTKNTNALNGSLFCFPRQTENAFKKKHYYIISNFYLRLLQNQIHPKNKFLLKQNINKLTKVFKINDFITYTEKYKIFNKNNSNTTKHFGVKLNNQADLKSNSIPFKSVTSLKWHFFFYKEKLNTKAEILLTSINKKIIQQTKEIANLLLNDRSIYKIKKKCHMNNLLELNSIKYYDILFFLKLKNFFFKKREIFTPENFSRKINFKPLNLEISYKTLTIIHLYPPQKIVFPCSIDVNVLLKNYI